MSTEQQEQSNLLQYIADTFRYTVARYIRYFMGERYHFHIEQLMEDKILNIHCTITLKPIEKRREKNATRKQRSNGSDPDRIDH